DRAQVAVYLCTDTVASENCNLTEATQAEKDAVDAILNSPQLAPLVDHYEFENHDEAYARYLEFTDADDADFITPELMAETFWVNLVDPTQSDVLVETLSGQPGVEEVVDQRKYLDPIFNALNAASFTAIGIASLMLVAAVLL